MTIDLGSTYLTYSYLSKNYDKALEQEATTGSTKLETANFEKSIGSITSVDDFVNNYRVFTYAMKAYGLEDMAYAKAYMKKVLESDLTDDSSFANSLSDGRFKAFAQAFQSLTYGEAVSSDTVSTVETKYAQQTMEDNAGASDTGVQLALYFKRNASTVTSAYSILADEALYKVVKATYNIPDEMSNAGIEAQAALISKHIDIEELQDPDYVDKLLKQFSIKYDIENNSASDPVLQLFNDTSSVSSDTAGAILNLKYGG
ncbi:MULTISPECIES: DUF1217 domain-containing protein [Azorhizobium]|nr:MULTISPECIES: DUF1217 domain-containing protein [Azorhizobium]TDT99581.1 uncharacterized protein DUF1217 [Azorhizobium sp. AG788]